jgi:hypothetical protein
MNPTQMSRVPNVAPLMRAVFILGGLLTAALVWSMSR